jgi:hypothetical protein
VGESPLEGLLAAVDRLDVDAAIAMCAPDCSFMTVDGRHAEDRGAARQLLSDFLSQVRRISHEITSQWHFEEVWIAEVLATYELVDWLRIERLPRAFVVRAGTDGIYDLRGYGANEHRLSDHRTGDEPRRVGGRLLLPL